MAGFYRLLRAKWYPPAPPTTSFVDKTVLITGANTGLGFDAAKHFLNLGAAHLIIGVRSIDKGNAARNLLEQAFPLAKGNIDVLPLDMNSYDSVKSFASHVCSRYQALDVALLNAGISNRTYSVSPEGWEETLQVNTLSTSLLALLLLPKLRVSERDYGPTHMVIVSSSLYSGIKREELSLEPRNVLKACSDSANNFAGQRQYAKSKLFIMYAVKELAALATTSGGEPQVIVTSCCPGACVTNLGRQYNRWYERLAIWLFAPIFARSIEEGSRTLVSAAELGPEAQGGFWKNDELKRYACFYHTIPTGQTTSL